MHNRTKELGDFQTPDDLALEVCQLLQQEGIQPASVLEPTCGQGSFLVAAARTFNTPTMLGLDIQPEYVIEARQRIAAQGIKHARVEVADFFQTDWDDVFRRLPEPILIIGNPPWVTNAGVSSLRGSNLPAKTNFQGHKGLDAITGKSNFDISEWMMIQLLAAAQGRHVTLAMLLKTAVARKTLLHSWKSGLHLGYVELREIDSAKHFAAAVSACALLARLSPGSRAPDCHVFPSLAAKQHRQVIGFHDDTLIADVAAYRRLGHLQGVSPYEWRSGVKHDCSRVMEFSEEGGRLVNGLGETPILEPDYLYPMFKTSELAGGLSAPRRQMLVPQRSVGDDTSRIRTVAPHTWRYLQSHADLLGNRGSSIYRNRPPFSVFGIGEYSFANWKVAISGFYKSLNFRIVGPHNERPVMLDDTSYFTPCTTRKQAATLAGLLNGQAAQDFFRAFVFWDAKRPITAELLRRLDIAALAEAVGVQLQVPRRQESLGAVPKSAALAMVGGGHAD